MNKRNKRSTKGQKLKTGHLESIIIRVLKNNPKKRYNAKQLVKKAKIKNTRDSVHAVLEGLAIKKMIVLVKDEKFKWAPGMPSSSSFGARKMIEGKVDITRIGSAYIISKDIESDVFVPFKNMNQALHGDTVEVEVYMTKGRRKPEGQIVKIIERAHSKFSGTFKIYGRHGVVKVNHSKMNLEVRVYPEDFNGAVDNDWVIVNVKKYTNKRNSPIIGRVEKIFDQNDRNEMEMNTILINNGFDLGFSEEVIAETKLLSDEITAKDLSERRDFRDVYTFTIDPSDAKDFDDAISYKELDNGHIQIGVHIADVTHFLKADTALDREAFARSTSVYLVDRVCPMLPERISNELCSLRPNEDKFCFSTVFDFDEKYKIVDQWIGRTLIHSDKRFTYEEAQTILDRPSGAVGNILTKCNQIAKKLKEDRFKNGSISFESEEVKFILDENNFPTGVYVKERKDANMLIEDYMLLANKTVAKFVAKKSAVEIPFVYRIHDEPHADRLADFGAFAAEMGVKMKLDSPKNIAASFDELHKKARENDEYKMLEPMAIRCMSKAIYSSENIGHYGLAFDFYSHFTSPIRRYSDVLTHRILNQNLKDKIHRVDKIGLESKCMHISAQERKATDAERQSIKYKQVEYLFPLIGQTFEAQISGFIEKGIFIELTESKAEGMVRFDRLDEPYAVTKNKLIWEGIYTQKKIKMGDKVKVKLLDVNMEAKQVEFELVT